MTRPPTLEIISDTEADIVRGEHRYRLQDGCAPDIIAAYRHCLSHKETGPTDAALYLWGVTAGLHHYSLLQTKEIIEDIAHRRTDRQRPTEEP